MSFGKKGLASGQAAPAPGGFGRAAPAASATPAAAPVDDMAAKREAFIAAERARAQGIGQTNIQPAAPAAPDAQEVEHDPLINLRNMHRPARPAQPMAEATLNGGPIGASGMSAQQEAEIRAAARGMARNQAPRGASTSRGGAGSGYFFGDPHTRNLGIAYLCWFVLGQASLHRFYCGQKDSAIMQVCLFVGSLVTLFIFPPIGVVGFLLWILWLFGDLFMIPGMLRKFQDEHDQTRIFA